MSTAAFPLSSDEAAWLTSYVQECPETELAEWESMLGVMDTLVLPTCPKVPTPRQADFLALKCEEALYGGAAGGAKSEGLLFWLAEGIPYEGYAGLVFRRTYPQLKKSQDSLIPKSFRYYKPMGGVWNGGEHSWFFPKYGSKIEFGHLQHEDSVYDYQGPSYHRIAFDELTQFTESQYLYLFSRKRRRFDFPIAPGIRAASNPGGIGHLWVRNRFVTKEALTAIQGLKSTDPSEPGSAFWATPDRAFMPARLADNPFLNADEYRKSLAHLDPVTREQLMNGDWSIQGDGRIKASWLRYYRTQGDMLLFEDADGKVFHHIDRRECRRFQTIDPAGTAKQKAAEARGKPHSHSVISDWELVPQREGGFLVWKDLWRGQVETPELRNQAVVQFTKNKPAWVGCENAGIGLAVYQLLVEAGLPVRALCPEGQDKLVRATTLLNMLEAGRVYLPKFAPWRDALEAELLAWTGHPDETADQIDTAAYAADEAQRELSEMGAPWMGNLTMGLR